MRPMRNNALAMVAPVLPAEIIALALPSRTDANAAPAGIVAPDPSFKLRSATM